MFTFASTITFSYKVFDVDFIILFGITFATYYIVSMKYHLKQSYIPKEMMKIISMVMVKEKERWEISGISLNLSSTSLK
ncbi:hypothetical protein [Wolbachia endosymbiont (group A) of Tiphia femorata]|uniref:hypothetical protein n=1 Tax=Wolbachia endosymbiont (group A) of Tiphia femorata TaxID=2954063 RepID=UPI002231723F|nr:hypothetical protein [Wolbachia endosymbiont (group A) of Tiphia femorata]